MYQTGEAVFEATCPDSFKTYGPCMLTTKKKKKKKRGVTNPFWINVLEAFENRSDGIELIS